MLKASMQKQHFFFFFNFQSVLQNDECAAFGLISGKDISLLLLHDSRKDVMAWSLIYKNTVDYFSIGLVKTQ